MNANIDLSNVILKTNRLILRPWRQSDLQDFFAYASVKGVGEMAGWPAHENIEVSQKVLDMFIEGKKTFALEYQGKVIGSLGIEKYNEERFPELKELKVREIGYVLSKDYWGQGLMSEAVKEVIRYLFEDVGLDAILCGHFIWNKRSQRVQEKCGFVHYGSGVYRTQMDTDEEDEVNILWKKDWLKLKELKMPERLSRKTIYESDYVCLYSDEVKMPDGSIVENYHQIRYPKDAVCIVIFNEKDEILFILNKRYTLSKLEWEIPAGKVEDGERNEDAALREAKEETGCDLKDLKYLFTFDPANGMLLAKVHCFAARVEAEETALDDNEVAGKKWFSIDEALKLFENNETECGVTMLSVLYALKFYLRETGI